MKILLIIDQFDNDNNGTTISARRFADTLRRHGNEIRVVCTGEDREDKYAVREFRVPIFDGLIKSQGMCFARPNKTTLEEAVRWAEVVHFLMPFPSRSKEKKSPSSLGFPIRRPSMSSRRTSPLPSGLGTPAASTKRFTRDSKPSFYNKFTHIHCPSQFIASQLEKNGYTAKLHVISNGIDSDFVYRKKRQIP